MIERSTNLEKFPIFLPTSDDLSLAHSRVPSLFFFIPRPQNPNPNSKSPAPIMSKTLTLIPLLLFLLLLTPLPPSTATIGLDSFLSDEFRRDPLATDDSFSSLPQTLKKSLSQAQTLNLAPSSLLSFEISVPVYVKLAGSFSAAAPSTLSSFSSAASASGNRFHVIGHKSHHHLSISHSLHLDPTHSRNLDSMISAAVRAHIDSSPSSSIARSHLLSVPYSLVDDIVRKDFEVESSNSAPGFYIYLLNLDPQQKPYAYSYDGQDASPHYSKCLGSVWAGKERYIWIDLAAGPLDYGPALSGEGVLPRGEFHPLSALHKMPRSEDALLADLASLVLSAYKTLLAPSLRIPVYFENSLLIQLVHIHGPEESPVGLDWGFIEKTIRESELAFRDQELKVKAYSVKYEECSICSFAIAKSMNSFTSRFLFENYTLIVSEYLDSKQLHHILSYSVDEIHRVAGIGDEEFGRVLPVYVFDLPNDKLLMLDRFHQAVSFRDMVVAVRTRTTQTVSDYSCNGRHMITQTRNLNRPIVGSILQSMWGVSPTHLSWSPQHNSTLVDYTWSVGQTPFGPFSDSASLSFVQRDAARRNVLLTSFNYTISSAVDILESMMAHGGDRKLLQKNKHAEFVQRWNLLKFKLDKVVSAMSHLDYEKAMFYLRSSDHDLYAIHTLVYQATQSLEASLVCFKDPPFPWAPVSISAVFVFGFFYVYSKKDKIFQSKRKQF